MLLLEITEDLVEVVFEAAEFAAVEGGESCEDGVAFRGERHETASGVGGVGVAGDEAVGFGAVDELDGGVGAAEQDLGDLGDGGWTFGGLMSTDGEEELVLGGGQAFGTCSLFGEVEELS